MDFVSRPVQILLAVTLAFAALWFVALRPKADSSEPSAPAAAKTGASAQRSAPAGGAVAAPARTAAAPSPVAATTKPRRTVDRSGPLLADLARGKVVVMLFWNPRASDDRAVRGVLREVDRRGGRVAVHSAPISRVADYASITNGVQVLGSPSALVIDRNRRARQVTGFNDARAIDQAVGDALAGHLAA